MDTNKIKAENENIFPDEETKKVCAKALKLLLHKDRTVEELAGKLRDGGAPERAIEFAIEYASGYGYLDDASYARKYVEYKKETRSRREIIYKLRGKGVSDADIEEAFEDYSETDEVQAASALLVKRLKGTSMSGLEYDEKMKHRRYLAGKGFPMSVISKAIKKVEKTDLK